jgi:D-alanyl-D-alanine carboxypeptidase (penicillin-binding protein 5/6)
VSRASTAVRVLAVLGAAAAVVMTGTVGARTAPAAGGASGPTGASGARAGDAPSHEVASLPPQDRYPKAAPSYLVDLDGTVLWARAPDAPRAPASLVKIMTALVVLDEGFDPSARVAISPRAARETGSRLGVRAGETVTAGELLDGMLIGSANDAAVALAEHAAGSVGAFVALMNLEAKRLGLRRTRFGNPTGLDARGQLSTARELRILTEAALARPEFTRRIAMTHAVVTTGAGRAIEVVTTNELLGRVTGARGVKTGTTAKAGECLIALVDRDGHRVVLVLLGAKERWWTAAALIEAAFREAGPPQR